MRPHRHSDGADGARPEHGVLVRCEYNLLAPKDPAGNPATAEPQGRGDSPKYTKETGQTYGRDMGTGEQNGQRTLLACIQTEDKDEERGSPERQRAINACSHQGGEGGDPPPSITLFLRAAKGWRGTPWPGCALPQSISRIWRRGVDPPHSSASFLRTARG